MDKVINIGSTPVRLATNGLALLTYKREFGTDLIPDLFAMYGDQKSTCDAADSGKVDVEKLDIEKLFNITYLFAKIADKSIGTRDEWLESLDSFPVSDVAQDVIPFVIECLTTDADVKKQLAAAGLRSTVMRSKQKASFWRRHRRA